MGKLDETNPSLWVDTTPSADTFPALPGDAEADAVVVGSGITGLTTALMLGEAGVRVMVIEADRVCSGVTAYTTAKVTSLHGLIYGELERHRGAEVAAAYAQANQNGLETIVALVDRLGIDCDLQRAPAYTYADTEEKVAAIEAEAIAAQRAGLRAAVTSETDLPFPRA